MRHAIELRANGRVDFRVPVPVDIAPQAAYPVDITLAIDIPEHAALSPLQYQRLVLGHLRKGVPDERAVPGFYIFNIGNRHVHHGGTE